MSSHVPPTRLAVRRMRPIIVHTLRIRRATATRPSSHCAARLL